MLLSLHLQQLRADVLVWKFPGFSPNSWILLSIRYCAGGQVRLTWPPWVLHEKTNAVSPPNKHCGSESYNVLNHEKPLTTAGTCPFCHAFWFTYLTPTSVLSSIPSGKQNRLPWSGLTFLTIYKMCVIRPSCPSMEVESLNHMWHRCQYDCCYLVRMDRACDVYHCAALCQCLNEGENIQGCLWFENSDPDSNEVTALM